MNQEFHPGDDTIPVLSDVVIPGHAPAADEPAHPAAPETLSEHATYTLGQDENARLLHERLSHHAALLMADMDNRIEQLVEEELAHAHATALEIARQSLHARLRVEMQERIALLLEGVLTPTDSNR